MTRVSNLSSLSSVGLHCCEAWHMCEQLQVASRKAKDCASGIVELIFIEIHSATPVKHTHRHRNKGHKCQPVILPFCVKKNNVATKHFETPKTKKAQSFCLVDFEQNFARHITKTRTTMPTTTLTIPYDAHHPTTTSSHAPCGLDDAVPDHLPSLELNVLLVNAF